MKAEAPAVLKARSVGAEVCVSRSAVIDAASEARGLQGLQIRPLWR